MPESSNNTTHLFGGRTMVFAIGGVGAAALVATAGALVLGGTKTTSAVVLAAMPVYILVCAFVIMAMSARVPEARARRRLQLVGLGTGAAALAEAVWGAAEGFPGLGIAYPGPSEILYVISYGLIFVALVSELREWQGAVPLSWPVLESLVATGLLGAMIWMLLLRPAIRYSTEPPVEMSTNLTYLMLTLLVLVAPSLAVMLTLMRVDDRASFIQWGVFGVGALLMLAADLAWVLSSMDTGWRFGSLVDFGWMCCYLAFAVSASVAVDALGVRPAAP